MCCSQTQYHGCWNCGHDMIHNGCSQLSQCFQMRARRALTRPCSSVMSPQTYAEHVAKCRFADLMQGCGQSLAALQMQAAKKHGRCCAIADQAFCQLDSMSKCHGTVRMEVFPWECVHIQPFHEGPAWASEITKWPAQLLFEFSSS